MIKKIIIGIIGISLLIINICYGQPADKLYVATNGNDSWTGKLSEPNAEKTDGPFATLIKAKNYIFENRPNRHALPNTNPLRPIYVLIRGGIYYLDKPIVFRGGSYGDSGTDEYPITYMAYPGEEPIISGGKKITASWKPYKGEILVCTIPEVKEGKLYFRQLSVNGGRQKRARIPYDGFLEIEKREDAVADSAFRYKEGDFKKWHNLNDVEVVWNHSWSTTRHIVYEVDEKNRIVRCINQPDANYPIAGCIYVPRHRYYIENVFEGLQHPGDWYLDRNDGKLYYWPIDNIDINNIENQEIIIPVLDQLVNFTHGAQNIDIIGLTFQDTRWNLSEIGYDGRSSSIGPAAINFEYVRHITLKDNCIRNVGADALNLTGFGNKIIGNKIYSTGRGGIITKNFEEEPNTFLYNHIYNLGIVYPQCNAISVGYGGGVIGHNLIHDIPYTGIGIGINWPPSLTPWQPAKRESQQQELIIEFNEIYNIMQKLNDGAAIFTHNNNVTVRNNLIHDVFALEDGSPGWGIYTGCNTTNALFENNIVYRTDETVHIWKQNKNVTLVNNILVDGGFNEKKSNTSYGKGQVYYQGLDELDHHVNVIFNKNIVYYTNPNAILFRVNNMRSAPWISDYNVLFWTEGSILNDSGVCKGPGINSFKDWREHGFDRHSIIADPLFVNPKNDNYTLKDDSPAFKIGFEPIDLSSVGLRAREEPVGPKGKNK